MYMPGATTTCATSQLACQLGLRRSGISPLASVCAEAQVGEGCYIGDFAVVEAGVKIGNGCQIYPQVYLGTGVSVGEGTILYPGVKVYEGCLIGRNCILHAGAVIGADGFGFMPNAAGGFDKIPQLGNVVIEDDVEIGANTCIDRAKTDSTVIRRGVKLDNLIQIGHNVQIGENTVSSAQTGIAGTSKVGRNCFLAGQVGIADHVTIGDRMKGYVRKITEDNRIDVSLQQEGYAQVKDSAEVLLQLVIGNGGHLPLNDDSSPEVKRLTEMSKKVFKRSLGVLMKRGAVEVGEDGIKVKRQ